MFPRSNTLPRKVHRNEQCTAWHEHFLHVWEIPRYPFDFEVFTFCLKRYEAWKIVAAVQPALGRRHDCDATDEFYVFGCHSTDLLRSHQLKENSCLQPSRSISWARPCLSARYGQAIGVQRHNRRSKGTGEAACFDLRIDDDEDTRVWKYWPFMALNVGLHEKKRGKIE